MFKMLSKYFTRFKIVEIEKGKFVPFVLLFGKGKLWDDEYVDKWGWHPFTRSGEKVLIYKKEFELQAAASDPRYLTDTILLLKKELNKRAVKEKKFKRKTTYL